MAESKKDDDLVGPIEIKPGKDAVEGRVGASKKGLAIAVGGLAAVVLLISYGVVSSGPGGPHTQKTDDLVKSDAPGQNLPPDIVAAVKQRAQEQKSEESNPPRTVAEAVGRGSNGQTQQQAAAPQTVNPTQQQSPREQHLAWLEKKKYERIQGRILAADAALTADLGKGGGGLAGVLRSSSKDDHDGDPLARVAALRNNAHENVRVAAGGSAIPVAAQSGLASGMGVTSVVAAADPAVAAQLRNKEFLKEAAETGYLPELVKAPLGRHELTAGSIIPAVMLSGINSDLPGVITAQTRQNVYDTRDEGVLLIPSGSRLVGRYSSQIAYGQERVLVAWDELIMPNGSRVNLRGMIGADGYGQAGFNDQVDTHFWRIWGSAALISMLGVGVQLSQPQNASYNNAPSATQQAGAAAANSLNQAGSKVLEKNLNVSPTLQIRPGYLFNVIVNKSIVMPAYK